MQVFAVLVIKLVHRIYQCHALKLVICGHFTDEHRTVDSILIPDIASRKVTVTLFKSEDKPILLALFLQCQNLLSNIFKTGEYINDLHAILFRNLFHNGGTYKTLDRNRIFRHCSVCGAHFADKLQQEGTYFVASKEAIVIPIFDCNTYTVTVRIGGQQ